MSDKHITITYTTADHDCDTCGSSYAESYILECNGKTYGEKATAHCFGNTEFTLDQVLIMFLEDNGYTFYYDSEGLDEMESDRLEEKQNG